MNTEGLIPHLAMGLSKYAARHSAALVVSGTLDIGSASCVEIASRLFLATAAHCLDGFPNRAIRIIGLRDMETTGFEFSKWSRSRTEDIAWIEIERAVAEREGIEAVKMDNLAPELGLESENLYMVLGVQAESAKNLIKRSPIVGFAKHVGYLLKAQGLLTRPAATQSSIVDHFELEYPRQVVGEEGTLVDQRHPGGMSGGGLWSATEPNGIWDPTKCRLMGIIDLYSRERDQLFAIPIGRWLALLLRDMPELAPHLSKLETRE